MIYTYIYVKALLINVVAVQDSCTSLAASNNENKSTIYLSSYNWYSKTSNLKVQTVLTTQIHVLYGPTHVGHKSYMGDIS